MADTKPKSPDEVPSKGPAEKKGAEPQSTKPVPPKMPPPKTAIEGSETTSPKIPHPGAPKPIHAPVPAEVPHPGGAPSAGSEADPSGEKFVDWVKRDMAHKQAQK